MALDNQNKDQMLPPVFSIQHFCLHDGPGIRSLVFLKGCPLRCMWCQNPESWRPYPEIAFKQHLCIGCGTCMDACPEHVISAIGNRDTDKCKYCFTCVENCRSLALVRFGEFLSVQAIVDTLRPEFPFYENSGGGVTFTGGEPTLHPSFMKDLAVILRKEGVHIALETCGQFVLKEPIWQLINQIDLLIYDIKLFDNKQHQQFCGADNTQILENFIQITRYAKDNRNLLLWPRLPVIPEITDTTENLSNWARFLKKTGFVHLTLVPFHTLGESKRKWLSMEPVPDINALTDQSLQTSIEFLNNRGITCYLPGEEDWPEKNRTVK